MGDRSIRLSSSRMLAKPSSERREGKAASKFSSPDGKSVRRPPF